MLIYYFLAFSHFIFLIEAETIFCEKRITKGKHELTCYHVGGDGKAIAQFFLPNLTVRNSDQTFGQMRPTIQRFSLGLGSDFVFEDNFFNQMPNLESLILGSISNPHTETYFHRLKIPAPVHSRINYPNYEN